MKKIWKTLLLSCLAMPASAQNLVNNWSFEDTVACPNGIGGINSATGWSSYGLSSDYFNSCANNQAGMPNNLFGYQMARTGNAYAGFYTYHTPDGTEYREFIGSQLIQHLDSGIKYYVTYYISRARNPNPGVGVNIATNKLCTKFSTVAYSISNSMSINNYAQVYTDSIITDTLNWVKVTGSFISDSAYDYIAFGNFFNDTATSKIAFDSISVTAYYYLDDICVSSDSNFCATLTTTNDINSKETGTVFPNPIIDWMMIKADGVRKISIYDVLGNLCFSKPFEQFSVIKINTSFLRKGVYILNIETIKKEIIKKIIIN